MLLPFTGILYDYLIDHPQNREVFLVMELLS